MPRQMKWSEEQTEIVRKFWEAGATDREIGRVFGVSLKSVQTLRSRNGMTNAYNNPQIDDEEYSKLMAKLKFREIID